MHQYNHAWCTLSDPLPLCGSAACLRHCSASVNKVSHATNSSTDQLKHRTSRGSAACTAGRLRLLVNATPTFFSRGCAAVSTNISAKRAIPFDRSFSDRFMRSTEILILPCLFQLGRLRRNTAAQPQERGVDLVREGTAFPRCRRHSRERPGSSRQQGPNLFTLSLPSREGHRYPLFPQPRLLSGLLGHARRVRSRG